jgi:quercetin dioxygenase-like cupin family protein
MITVMPVYSFSYDGARINVYHANKGQGLPMHGHIYSHATMCNSGSCLITLDNGKTFVMNKNTQPVNLLANIEHQIEALEDGTVFVNIFSEAKS